MKPSCIELNRALQGNWFEFVKIALRCPNIAARRPYIQLNHLRRVNVFARANLAQQVFAWRVVEIQHRERGTAGLISAE